MIILQFTLPSNDPLVVLDYVIGQCKCEKCLTTSPHNINKIQHDGLKPQNYPSET